MSFNAKCTGQLVPEPRAAYKGRAATARAIAIKHGWPVIDPLIIEPTRKPATTESITSPGRAVLSEVDELHWMLSDKEVGEMRLRERNERLRGCAEHGDLRGVRLMLRQGADIRAADELGETAMDKARAQFRSEYVGFTGRLCMARIIKELKKAEERRVNPEAEKETVGNVVSNQLKKLVKAFLTLVIGAPLAIAGAGAAITAGIYGIVSLIVYPFEMVFGHIPKEFTETLSKIPKIIPYSISGILLATGTALTVAVGFATFNNLFIREKELRNLAEDVKTKITEICKTAFVFTSFSGYMLGALANTVYLSQTGQLSQAGSIMMLASAFAYRLSRFFMEKEKIDHFKLLELGSRDLAVATLVTVAIGTGMAYYNGTAVWTGNLAVAAGVAANYALVKWLLRNRKKSEKPKGE